MKENLTRCLWILTAFALLGAPLSLGAASKGVKVFEESMLDKKPKLESQVAPIYPYAMKTAGISGKVVVDFIVTAEGNVVNAFAVKSDRQEFVPAAIQCVHKWKYKPGTKNGQPVNTKVRATIEFSTAVKN